MAYSIEPLKDNCYENTSVLINKFGLKNQEQLNQMERNITAVLITKALEEIPFKNIDFKFYRELHKYIFGDIYEWAGNIRTVEISKKGTKFCPTDKIEQFGNKIFDRLTESNFLKNSSENNFIENFIDIYCDLNYLHPFREGNGRIQRLFLSMLIKNLGKELDFSKIDKDLLMIATIKSVSGDIFMLRDIFREFITET